MKEKAISVLYSDAEILAVDKPAGLAVTPDRWDDSERHIVDLLEPANGRLWTVHRLDRDTSGVLLFARTLESHKRLSAVFEARAAEKVYLAIVAGRPEWKGTVADFPLKVDGDRFHRTLVDATRGKQALTRFAVLKVFGNYALLEARPETGRTHQIRAHLARLGYPVLCDPLYGDGNPVKLSSFKRGWKGDEFEEKPLLSRQALHASSLKIPLRGDASLSLSAPLPKDMAALINQLEKALGAESIEGGSAYDSP